MAILSGLLLGVSFPPFPFSPAAFVCLVPLALALEHLPADPAPVRRAACLGAETGAVAWGVLLCWTWAALAHVPLLGALAFLTLVAAFAALTALVAASAWVARRRMGLGAWLALPAAWVAGEWLRGHLGPLSFPWLPLPVALSEQPRLLGLLPWVGTAGASLWLAVPQAAWAGWLARTPRAGSGRVQLLLRLLATVAWWSVGALLVPGQTAVTHRVMLEIVQPDVPAHLPEREHAERSIAAAARVLDERPADVVLLPEGALPVDLERSPTLVDPLRRWARLKGATVLVGGLGRRGDGTGKDGVSNAVFRIGPTGLEGTRYDKRRLVPVIERTPFLRLGGGLVSGDTPGVFVIDGVRYGVLICYESIFPDLALDLERSGVDVLVNLTNDAWYRDPGPGSLGLWQHPAHLVIRALELGRPVVRAANTGPSLLIDARGRVEMGTPARVEDLLRLEVMVSDSPPTLFSRTGDLVGPLAAVLLLVSLLLSGRLRPVEPVSGFH